MELFLTIIYASAGLFGFFIWIFMLIDVIKNKQNPKRTMWILIIIFLGVIGAIIYTFVVKLRKQKELPDQPEPQIVQGLAEAPQATQEHVVQELKETAQY